MKAHISWQRFRLLFFALANLGHFLAFSSSAHAQATSVVPNTSGYSAQREKDEYVASYVTSFPTAGTRDFISDTSFLGFGFDWGHYIRPQLSVGLSIQWHRFYQEDDRQTYQVDNGTITGKQYKAIYTLPILPRIKFNGGGPDSKVVPYVLLGLGPIYGQKYREVGAYSYNNFGWQFGFAPEVGVFWRSFKLTGVQLSLRYDAGLGTDAFPAFSAFNLSLGLRQVI